MDETNGGSDGSASAALREQARRPGIRLKVPQAFDVHDADELALRVDQTTLLKS